FMRPLLSISLIVACAATAFLSAQETADPPAIFRSEVNYVEFPVRIVDTQGNFVRGLVPADFQVFEDGKRQTIETFRAVDLPDVPSPERSPGLVSSAQLETVASSAPLEVGGRVYLFLLDDLQIEPAFTFKARQIVGWFIREQLKAGDLAAVVMT